MDVVAQEIRSNDDTRSGARSPATLKVLATAGFLMLAVFICWKYTLESSDTIRWGSYALSEWLIIGWSIRHFPPLAAAAIVPRSELPAGE
jgi:hypothetical protein